MKRSTIRIRKRRKKPISDGAKYRALKAWGHVKVLCYICASRWIEAHKTTITIERISADGHVATLAPQVSIEDAPIFCWHSLRPHIHFDHVLAEVDLRKSKPTTAKDLKPACTAHHGEKSAKETVRHKKTLRIRRGGRTKLAGYRPMKKGHRPMGRGRGFDKTRTRGFDNKVRPRKQRRTKR